MLRDRIRRSIETAAFHSLDSTSDPVFPEIRPGFAPAVGCLTCNFIAANLAP